MHTTMTKSNQKSRTVRTENSVTLCAAHSQSVHETRTVCAKVLRELCTNRARNVQKTGAKLTHNGRHFGPCRIACYRMPKITTTRHPLCVRQRHTTEKQPLINSRQLAVNLLIQKEIKKSHETSSEIENTGRPALPTAY